MSGLLAQAMGGMCSRQVGIFVKPGGKEELVCLAKGLAACVCCATCYQAHDPQLGCMS